MNTNSYSFIRVILTSVAALLLFVSCKSTESTTGSAVDPEISTNTNRNTTDRDINPSLPLIAAIRNLPGVLVTGGGIDYQIRVRGVASFGAASGNNNNPLFVVDGIPFGRSYNDVAGSVSMSDVTAVRLLRGSELTRRFGGRGSSGVIEIITRQANSSN